MPLKQCSSDGKSGWKWGDEGHCYTGPDAKKKALKQGYAISPNEFKKKIVDSVRDETITVAEACKLANELYITDMMFWVAIQCQKATIKELPRNE